MLGPTPWEAETGLKLDTRTDQHSGATEDRGLSNSPGEVSLKATLMRREFLRIHTEKKF